MPKPKQPDRFQKMKQIVFLFSFITLLACASQKPEPKVGSL